MELCLKSLFPDAYKVSIESVCRWGDGFGVLVTIWETNEYRARWSMLLQMIDLEITQKFFFDKEVKWRCVLGLENGKYLLGSYHRGSEPALVALFQGEEKLKTISIDKGYATGVLSIDRSVDDNILIEGEYYRIEPAGSHDEYYSHGWRQEITEALEGAEGLAIPQRRICYEEGLGKDVSRSYFVYDRYLIGKYSADGEHLWEQDTALTGQERASMLLAMAPYYSMNGETLSADGIWAGGKRAYADHEKGTGLYFPTLFRLSAGGTLLNFSQHLEAILHLQSVLSIISGNDRSCHIIGETLIVGEGNGLCIVHVALVPHVVIKSVRYVNLKGDGLPPAIEEAPSFCGEFISIINVCQDAKEKEFTVFLNTREINHSYGKIWSLSVDE